MLKQFAYKSLSFLMLCIMALLPLSAALAAVIGVELVSQDGDEGNGASITSRITPDGRYVVFQSAANDLVAGDSNGQADIFVYDRQTDSLEHISVNSDEIQANGASEGPSISADGQFVAFHSFATNLALFPDVDTNANWDIFVRDRTAGTTERVSLTDGDVEADSGSLYAMISGNGRYVAFESPASNLVTGDTNAKYDVFVRDRVDSTTVRVSVDSSEAEVNDISNDAAISSDGHYVAFVSSSANLVPGDADGLQDVFVRDLLAGTTERVSQDSTAALPNGHSYNPSLSSDGRYVAFHSSATDLVAGDGNGFLDVFVYDRDMDVTERVSVNSDGSEANNNSSDAAISPDGGFVAFTSSATDLGGPANAFDDIFVHDRAADTTQLASMTTVHTAANGNSQFPSLSNDGQFVAFESDATNLVAGDGNSARDAFVVELMDPPAKVVGSFAPAQNSLTTNYKPLFNWMDAAGSDSYDLQVSLDSNFGSFLINQTNIMASQFQMPTNLPVKKQIFWQVRGVNEAGEGAWSNLWVFKTAVTKPVTQLPKHNSTTTDRTPKFQWKPVAGAASYTLQVSKNAAFTILVVNKGVKVNTYTVPANLQARGYFWRVRANAGAFGPSLWSAVFRFTIQ